MSVFSPWLLKMQNAPITNEIAYLPKQQSTKTVLRMVPGITPEACSDSVRHSMDCWEKKNSRYHVKNSVLLVIMGHYVTLALFNLLI